MTCLRCGKHSEYTPAAGRRCPHCGAEAAFEPREGDPVSDALFAETLGRVSSDGTLRFTAGQLYYELCRTLGPGTRETLDRPRFDGLWARWQAVHGAPPGLVAPWATRPGAGPREVDIGDYSFDRVVITDSAWMVDFLLANNFHFETNSAVLSMDGHPAGRFDMIRGMLRRNPRIIVIAIHDASVEGCSLARRLVTEDGWFREHGHVVDVGLSAAHRALYSELWRPRAEPLEAPAGADAEAEWLCRYSLDLAVVRPEKALRRLFRASRKYMAFLTEPGAPATGQVLRDDALLGPGKHRRLAAGEELD